MQFTPPDDAPGNYSPNPTNGSMSWQLQGGILLNAGESEPTVWGQLQGDWSPVEGRGHTLAKPQKCGSLGPLGAHL